MPVDRQREWVTRYNTLTNPHEMQNHGAALINVGAAAGMATIIYEDLEYADSKARIIYVDTTKSAATRADPPNSG